MMVYLICWNVYFGITGSGCGSGDSICYIDRNFACLVPVMDVICRIVLEQDTRTRTVIPPDEQVAPSDIIGWTHKLLSGSVDCRNNIYLIYLCRLSSIVMKNTKTQCLDSLIAVHLCFSDADGDWLQHELIFSRITIM